jgi:hypothetical protein
MENDTRIESRISGNAHFADHLRARLLRRACPAVREILKELDDAQLINIYLQNEARGREHAAKLRTEAAGSEAL